MPPGKCICIIWESGFRKYVKNICFICSIVATPLYAIRDLSSFSLVYYERWIIQGGSLYSPQIFIWPLGMTVGQQPVGYSMLSDNGPVA